MRSTRVLLTPAPGAPIRGVLLDLDETLYPYEDFLAGALAAVADEGTAAGIDGEALWHALLGAAADHDDPDTVVALALQVVRADPSLAGRLVAAFHRHRPDVLEPHRGVANALDRLAPVLRLAVVTDGHPPQQRAKLEATGLADLFDAVVCTEDHGRHRRKPSPHGFRAALGALGLPATMAVAVGDRPDHDVDGAHAAGIVAIRVRHGRHAHHSSDCPTTTSTAEALDLIGARVGALR